jgi:hypothetical protein
MNLIIMTAADACGQPMKVARLQRENGEVLPEMAEVQVDTFKGSRIVLKEIEHKKINQGPAEYAQQLLSPPLSVNEIANCAVLALDTYMAYSIKRLIVTMCVTIIYGNPLNGF